MTWQPLDLALLDAAPTEMEGRPLQIAVGLIDEDPEQPRIEFDAASLAELAESIVAQGVLQPISIRPHPTAPGRWMLNFGARRLRASKLAGKATIAAFVDKAIDSYGQVMENEQREGLQPLELALFIKGRMALRESKAAIGRKLGKSPAYVTYASALIDAPDWLMDCYRSGRCRGIVDFHPEVIH